jgi:AraC-like DNA-binding protein
MLLLAFPLLFLYVSSLFNEKWFKVRFLINFAPFLLMFIYGAYIHAQFSLNEIGFYVKSKAAQNESIDEAFLLLDSFEKIVGYIYLIQGIVYSIQIFRMFQFHRKKFKDLYSDILSKDLMRLRAILTLIFAIIACYNIGVNTVGLDNIWSKDILVVLVLISIIGLTGALGILGARQNSIYDMDISYEVGKNEEDLSNQNLKKRINKLFAEDRVYLNKDLSIWDVCRLANSNRTYISNIINQEYQQNFNSFVNKYRVEKAKELLINDCHEKDCLEKIAIKSGFNSLASFNRAFKKFENRSPGSFRKSGSDQIVKQ